VGDGIPVTASADPVAFSNRLKNMYQGKAGTFHAVATGSSYEAGVLKTVASLGGGSWRKIGAEAGPTTVALELLREVAQPTLLDALLALGTSEAIKDEVIALSEECNIMTPYTSFLVLESDADRERFGVKKRFRMRDGEKFFAEGRDNVDFALMQQQMKRAGTW